MSYTKLSSGTGYAMTETYQEYADMVKTTIEKGSQLADSEAIKDLINDDMGSKRKKMAQYAKSYYNCDNDILKHDFNEYEMEIPVRAADNTITKTIYKTVKSSGANNKIAHDFLSDTIDQKNEFGLSNKPEYTIKKGSNIPADVLDEYLTPQFYNDLIDYATTASISGFCGLNFYYPKESTNSLAKLQFIDCDGIELIPIFDKETQKKLLQVIRYYETQFADNEGIKTKTIVEIWSSAGVEYWEKESDITGFQYTDFVANLSAASIVDGEKQSEKLYDFGRVPFALLWNNKEGISDLNPIKSLIDDYDFISSLTSNDISDLRQAFIFASGISENADEFRMNLNLYKVATTADPNGKMESITVALESEAREAQLRRNKDNIYRLSGSVDFYSESFMNAVSGEALKRIMFGLELRVVRFLRQVSAFMNDITYFCIQDYNRRNNTRYNYEDIGWKFNPKKLINENEVIQTVLNLKNAGVFDLKEAINQLPIELNKEDLLKRINDNLPELEDPNLEDENIDNEETN